MYSNIIVGYDGSAQSEDALALGRLLAGVTGASPTLAGVFYFSPRLGGRDPVLHDVESEHIGRLEEKAEAAGARAEATWSTSAARGLHALAEHREADLVVVGSAHHGRAGQIVAGSVGLALLHGSPCSIAIAPHGYAETAPSGIEEVTVGFDGSPEAQSALDEAVELARAANAPLRIVTVAEPPPIVYTRAGGRDASWHALKDDIEQVMQERLNKAAASIPEGVEFDASLVDGEARTALVEIARQNGVLMLGSRGYGPVRRVLLGSVSTELVRTAPCPVIVHPRTAGTHEEAGEQTAAGAAP